jgi:hypothetical protein
VNVWTRYTEIEPTERETAELKRRGSGMVQRDGRDICLLAQTDTCTVWGIPDVHGELMAAEISSIPLDAREKISEIATVIDDSYAQGFVVRADDETIRGRIRRIARRERGGTAPNASLILTADELAFIEERFNGSKSAAIHAALAALKQSK